MSLTIIIAIAGFCSTGIIASLLFSSQKRKNLSKHPDQPKWIFYGDDIQREIYS